MAATSLPRKDGASRAAKDAGAIRAGLSAGPVRADALVASLAGMGEGAVVTFEGRVRARNRERDVSALGYEAYEPMAEEVLHAIADEARERFGLTRVGITHRVGELEPGEVALALAVTAPHRAEAFEAASWIVGQVKVRLPIWKKEAYVDGTSEWLDGMPPPAGGAPGDSG